jgi:hypothetical protein
MKKFIELNRKFYELSASELKDTEFLANIGDNFFVSKLSWEDLLKYNTVILLAEAGSGKTTELQAKQKNLVNNKKYAFYFPLESLCRENIFDILSAEEELLFNKWELDKAEVAWFFLDAVDELKITNGKLDKALIRLSKSINANIRRARFIITSRPNDWHFYVDTDIVQDRLCLPKKTKRKFDISPEDYFTRAFAQDNSSLAEIKEETNSDTSDFITKTVAMLPLSNKQIRCFAKQIGISDVTSFLEELDLQNAWTFARRPLDIMELFELWRATKHLGTRTQQHEVNITSKLKENTSRPDSGILSEKKARQGAERLALALALTRTRTIRSPEQPKNLQQTESMLDPSSILDDWTDAERQTLLRKALFDPATYGRIRFHHSSVQEYLAACHLHNLFEQGLSIKTLFRMIFSNHYGEDIVFPSMRPIAAWLSLRNSVICRELIKREPESLLLFGDPESLNIQKRKELIRTFTSLYGHGDWRGLNIPIDEIRRLAHPDLEPVIRELWDSGTTNEDVRDLLVDMIWKGKIRNCTDIAYNIAFDKSWRNIQRAVAIKALIACKQFKQARIIIDTMLAQTTLWEDTIIFLIVPDLFPDIISLDELIALIKQIPEPQRTYGGFDRALSQIAESIDPLSYQAIALRDRIADLIFEEKNKESTYYDIKSDKGYLITGLQILCERQITSQLPPVDTATIRSCVIANYFKGKSYSTNDHISTLKDYFSKAVQIREKVFWIQVFIMDKIAPTKNDRNRYFQIERNSLIGKLTESDFPWLLIGLSTKENPEHHPIALHALLTILHYCDKNATIIKSIRATIEGDLKLVAIFEEATTPRPKSDEYEEQNKKHLKYQQEEKRKKESHIEKWKTWRDDVISNPEKFFSPEKCQETIGNIFFWLYSLHELGEQFDSWNKDAIRYTFSEGVANLAEIEFQKFWRTKKPLLWSEKNPAERNSTPYSWLYGLYGLSLESRHANWTLSLTPTEASLASRYATLELNGFAPFIKDIVTTYPEEVAEELGKELVAQIGYASQHDHLPLLQDLAHTDKQLQQLFTPSLLPSIATWPTEFSVEASKRLAKHLGQILGILQAAPSQLEHQQITEICTRNYKDNPFSSLGTTWLKGVFYLDPMQATHLFIDTLASSDAIQGKEHAIIAFGTVFGSLKAININVENHTQRAQILAKLVRYAYAFVRIEEDQTHEEAYTPDTRDKAQRARESLLSALLATPGAEAWRAILELAMEPDFSSFADRLRFLAREKAAKEAEFLAYTHKDCFELEQHHEIQPNDNDRLFSVMMDKIDELQYQILHHDFSDRSLLESIDKEEDMQRTLALRIELLSGRMFTVTREEEVADRKRTDIRLLTNCGIKAVIEIKIASKWSLTELENALTNQLIRQYLRHSTCASGCLLLTYNGNKQIWENTATGDRFNFKEVVTHLSNIASEIEKKHNFDIRVSVFGLDLKSPLTYTQ